MPIRFHSIYCIFQLFSGPGSSVGIATELRAGWTVFESRWMERFSATCPDRAWGPPSLLYNGYQVFPRGKERPGRDADPSPLLVPRSRKSRAIPLIHLWAVRPVQSLSACTVELYLYSPYGPYGLYRASVPVQYSYTSTPLSACTVELYL